jgi:hypothetical protein
MTSVQLIADTNVVSYIYAESTLGRAYEDLIDHRQVGLTGHTIAELRAGSVIGRWGERVGEETMGEAAPSGLWIGQSARGSLVGGVVHR